MQDLIKLPLLGRCVVSRCRWTEKVQASYDWNPLVCHQELVEDDEGGDTKEMPWLHEHKRATKYANLFLFFSILFFFLFHFYNLYDLCIWFKATIGDIIRRTPLFLTDGESRGAPLSVLDSSRKSRVRGTWGPPIARRTSSSTRGLLRLLWALNVSLITPSWPQ